jgi:uncharacterized C2H2 Zn-finger protein
MTVAELIEKLSAIEDKDIEMLFYCEECGRHIPIADMKGFGFAVPKSHPYAQKEDTA